MYWLQFQTRVCKRCHRRRIGKHEQFWKRWLKATTGARFTVSVGEKFIFCKKKMGDPALKVTDDGRGQLGHLQRELVPVLACFQVSILNHLNNKDFS